MLFETGTFYFAGRMLLPADADWERLAARLDMVESSARGVRIVPSRAVPDGDGSSYWMEFIGRSSQASHSYGTRGKGEFDDQEALKKELEGWLLYPVEMEFASPSDPTPEAFDLMDRVRKGVKPMTPFSRHDPITKDDICPREVAGGDPMAELDALIGLEGVKRQVRKIARMIEASEREELPVLHAVFLGNPGTGKTTVARLIARIYDEMGVTGGNGNFVEADREALVAAYVGQTAIKTKQVIEKAKGGTLFIDEAYSLGLYNKVSSIDYGAEAIATLVKEMEDHRNDPVVIMAGYTDPMQRMIDVNPGMRDRIGFYFTFPDYSAEELVEVFDKFAADDGLALSPAAHEAIEEALGAIVANKDDNFANGRVARKLYERVKLNHMIEKGSSDKEIGAAECEEALADPDIADLMGKSGKQAFRTGFA